jgi:serine/threonine-protein kinase
MGEVYKAHDSRLNHDVAIKVSNAEFSERFEREGTPFNEFNPAFSPDGRWLAYTSNESGTSEVYVRPFPGSGGRWQVSTGGGAFPVWSRDGRELLFRALLDRRVMAAGYTAKADSFAAGKPRVWTETRLRALPPPTTILRRTASALRRSWRTMRRSRNCPRT